MPTAPFPPAALPAGGRLLIVDDEYELMTVLSETLSREGFEVTGRSSGDAALEALREQPPFDLLLTDLMMPGLDGLALLKAALELDPQLVCVMMTGQGTVQTAVDAMKVGAFDYILKPFKLSAMLPVLTRAMEARRLRVEVVRLHESEQRAAAALARANSLLTALSRVAARIESTLDPEQVTKTLGAELRKLGIDYLVFRLEAESERLVLRHHAIESGVLPQIEKLLGATVDGLAVPRQRAPHFVEVIEQRQPVLVTDQLPGALKALAPLPRVVVEQVLRLGGVTPGEPAVYLPLVVEQNVIGVLNVWGADLGEDDVPVLSIFAAQVAAALEVARLHEQLKVHHIEEQAALLKLSEALLGLSDAQVMADTAVRTAAGALKVELAALTLIDPDGQSFSGRAGVGWPEEVLQRARQIPLTASTGMAYAIRTRAPVVVPDESRETRFGAPPWVTQMGIVSSLLVPMIVSGEGEPRVLGGLAVNSRTRRDWSDGDVRLLSLIANDTAQALERARLFEAERDQRELAEALRDALAAGAALSASLNFDTVLDRLLDQVARAVPYDSANIMLVDGPTGRIRIARMRGYEQFGPQIAEDIRRLSFEIANTPNLRRMAETGQPLVVPDTAAHAGWVKVEASTHVRSWAGAPILVGSEVLAFFSLDKAKPNFYRPEHGERLAAFSGQAALALQNARLFDAAREAEARFRNIVERLPGIAYLAEFGESGVWRYVSPQIERLLGFSPEEWTAQPSLWYRQLHPDDRERVMADEIEDWQQRASKAEAPEYRLIARDGRTVWVRDEAVVILDNAGRPLLWQGVLYDITERKQAEAAIERQLKELKVLHTIAALGVEAPDEDALIEKATLAIGQALYPDNFGVLLVDEPARVLRLHASYRGVSAEAKQTVIPLGHGVTGRVAADGQPRRIADVTREPDYVDLESAVRSELCAPLKVGERVIGVVNTESAAPDAFSEADERLLLTLAGQLATAIERLRREAAERDRARELEALAQVSSALRTAQTRAEMLPIILDQVSGLFDTVGAALNMRDPMTNETVVAQARGAWALSAGLRLPPGAGISGHVIATGQLYVNDDVLTDSRFAQPDLIGEGRAMACVPLIVQEQTIGTLGVGRQKPFTHRDVHLLTAVADMAANAIHRAALHEQTGQRLQYLAALRAVDMAISASLDLRVTLSVLLDQTMTQLRVDATDILLLNPALQTLDYAAGRGFRGSGITRSRLRVGEGHAGRAALERRTLHLPNLAKATTFVRAGLLAGENFVAHYVTPLIAKGSIVGVLEVFHRAPLASDPEWLNFLETLAGQAAIAVENARLFESLQRSNADLTLAYDATIEGWSRALDLRDRETEGHTQRVTEMTERLARAMGLSEAELVHVRRGGLLHDIGKMGVPDAILLKPDKLTDDEWKVMRLHPQLAYDMLAPIAYLQPALEIPYCHHEKWDGTGYPRGLAGEQIPLAARLFAVVDVWDALSSDRPYRKGWSEEKVLEHIRAGSGTHFDPQAVEAFLKMTSEGRQP